MRTSLFRSAVILLATGLSTTAVRAVQNRTTIPASTLGLIPLPRNITAYAARWKLPATIRVSAKNTAEHNVGLFLQRFLKPRGITVTFAATGRGSIRLSTTANNSQLGREGYRLNISSHGAALSANTGRGLFYALQTFEQLFNPAKPSDNAIHEVSISDWPRYHWRGILLDCSRHFFPVPVVEKFIRVAAHYKLNVFHWHLTDDQGWRIQIPQYPLLTKIGAWRAGTEMHLNPHDIDHKRYGGFYTDAQIRKIVAYAQRRYVTVVPEIDIPGHCTAALAAYPWLAAAKGPFHVRETWGISNVPLSPSARTFHFLDIVFGDLVDLFPGRYIHLGGDEVSAQAMKAWEHDPAAEKIMRQRHWSAAQLHDYFPSRMARFLSARGRRAVVWNDVPAAGLPKGTVIECWNSSSIVNQDARLGHDVIVADESRLYFNFCEGDPKYVPHATGAVDTLRETYKFNPSSLLPASLRHRLLGAEGCLWAEAIATTHHLFYQLLPREMALAEISWTPLKEQHYSNFVKRTARQYLWLRANGYNFRIPLPSFHFAGTDATSTATRDPRHNALLIQSTLPTGLVRITDAVPGTVIYYTLNGSMPNVHCIRYAGPIAVKCAPGKPMVVRCVAIDSSGQSSAPAKLIIQLKSHP